MWRIRNPEEPWKTLALQRYQLDFMLSPSYATLMSGGWGSGKTVAGLGFIAWAAWSSPERSIGVVVHPTYSMLSEWMRTQFLPAFSDLIVQHHVTDRYVVLPGERVIYYRSAHDPQQIQATNASWLYLDEPHLMGRAIWVHVVARVRRKNRRLRIGLTSLPRIGWLSEHFDGQADLEYRCIHAKTADNRHVDEDYVARLKRACPRRMWPAYLEGQFVATGGQVWPEFDPKVHVIPWKFGQRVQLAKGPHLEPVINLTMDPSARRPHVSWVQRVPPGALMPGGWRTKREVSIFGDEIYPDGQYRHVIIRRLCSMINKRGPTEYERWPYREAVTDPSAGAREQTASAVNETGITQLQKYLGVPILYLTGERVKVGVQHVSLALDPAEGHPFLFFAERLRKQPDCEETPELGRARSLLRAVPAYSYQDERRDGRLPDEPYHDDQYSHACDDVRYHVRQYHPEDRLSAEVWSAL